MKKSAGLLLMLLGLLTIAGCGTTTSPDLMNIMEDISREEPPVGMYQLRPQDPLVITLLGIPEERQIQTVIDEKGEITIPYIDEPVQAQGRTTSELERDIQRIYTEQQIYRNITVNVMTSSKTYYVEGEVRRPQEFPLNQRITLLQAIAAASGYTEYANRKKITIARQGEVIEADAKYLEKHPEEDIPIEAGDRIKVHRSLF